MNTRVTEPGRYPRLLSRIQSYRHEITRRSARSGLDEEPWLSPIAAMMPISSSSLREAARAWLEGEYRPVVEVLRAERIDRCFPGRALGDLYGYVCDHRWYLSERRGWDVGLDTALLDFIHRFAPDPAAAALLDQIVALAVGFLALPIAFLRGLRPRHDRFPRRLES